MSMSVAKKKDKNSKGYRQGLANLALEGLHLTPAQNRLVMRYHRGEISKAELLKKAADYARGQ